MNSQAGFWLLSYPGSGHYKYVGPGDRQRYGGVRYSMFAP